MAQVGVITLVWYFEQNYKVGYTSIWWALMEGPAWIVMALSGWVIVRFRQTRALTMAQFFEMRYSRRFRIFAGIVAFVAGIINFAIFPSIGARFFHLAVRVSISLHIRGPGIGRLSTADGGFAAGFAGVVAAGRADCRHGDGLFAGRVQQRGVHRHHRVPVIHVRLGPHFGGAARRAAGRISDQPVRPRSGGALQRLVLPDRRRDHVLQRPRLAGHAGV